MPEWFRTLLFIVLAIWACGIGACGIAIAAAVLERIAKMRREDGRDDR